MSALYNLEPQPTAKVLLTTTSGDLSLELFAKQTPLASRNFFQHCLDGYYDQTIFHSLVPGFVLQGGDLTGTEHGGESIYEDKDKSVNAFGWAAWGGYNAVIQLLFQYGLPGVDEEDEFEWTLVFWPLEASNCTTVETLLATGKVNVNHRDHSGRTALFWTAGYGKEDMVKVLLAAEGIDADAMNDEGHTPLQWAQKLDKQGTAALLENFLQRKVKSSQ